jgi:hypothetical protein
MPITLKSFKLAVREPVEFSKLELNSKALTAEVIARKRAREFTNVTPADLEDGRYEHIIFFGKG